MAICIVYEILINECLWSVVKYVVPEATLIPCYCEMLVKSLWSKTIIDKYWLLGLINKYLWSCFIESGFLDNIYDKGYSHIITISNCFLHFPKSASLFTGYVRYKVTNIYFIKKKKLLKDSPTESLDPNWIESNRLKHNLIWFWNYIFMKRDIEFIYQFQANKLHHAKNHTKLHFPIHRHHLGSLLARIFQQNIVLKTKRCTTSNSDCM